MDIKPFVDRGSILELLNEAFNQPIEDLEPVSGGLTAQTLSFRSGGQEFILRFNPGSFDVTFLKEKFIFDHFASTRIPIPPILKTGSQGELSYAISQKMPGQGLQSLDAAGYQKVIPSLIETLYAIHTSDVKQWHGYGWIGDDGEGMFPSWKGFIARVIEEEREDGFYGRWHDMFETTFLERDFFENVYAHMLRLLDFCPEQRYLVHFEYGYNNVLAENGKVTAVLDWTDASYGDFVYDVAVMDLWPPAGVDFPKLVHQYYTAHGVDLPHYKERLDCYQCYSALDGLRFFAKTNDYDAYLSTRRILEKITGL